ncbi:amidohydrolase family protein [Alphaproteobacteria bacterium KMM 3653]|uniref:Amidohydrolase family protein n=1 Tax=Harenicola maris TaxID=2841044 RepID=A0AAP2CP50_9RHOB|nr:amidohydrolase family protein [Harenicola maris]
MGLNGPIIDAHHHFWRIDRGVNSWITDDIAAIRRDYLHDHLAPYVSHLGIDGTVLVQASETWSENTFMAEQAAACGFVKAVVGWVDLSDAAAVEHLQDLARQPIVKAVRPVLQGIDDPDWILRPDVIANVAKLVPLGLRFDALIQPRHLPVIDRLARTLPDLPIVINHCAKPEFHGTPDSWAAWNEGISRLSQHPQICCKLSGLAAEYGPGWNTDAFLDVADYVITAFGPSRVMWGSDWPVLELDGSYPQWLSCIERLIAKYSPDEQAEIMGKSAMRYYGITA